MQKAWLFITLFLFTALALNAQEAEQEKEFDLDSLLIKRSAANSHFLAFDSAELRTVDFLQLYRPLPFPRLPMARSSNIGLPVHSLQVQPQEWNMHFLQGGYRQYVLGSENVNYYKVNRPITLLNYTNGAESEQYFEAFHTQNLGEGLNITFRYDRAVSEGFFPRQFVNHTRFHTTYNLQSRNRRFLSHGYYAISTLESQENGGIFIDSTNQESDNTALLGINLFNAQNRSRGRELGVQNMYKVFQLSDDTNKLAADFLGVYHKFTLNRSWRNFEHQIDNENPFFNTFFLDSARTADSSMVNLMGNEIGLQWNEALFLGMRQRDYRYYQNAFTDTTFSSQHLVVGLSDSLFSHLLTANFEKGLSGFEQNEYLLNARLSGQLKSIKYALFIESRRDEGDYFLRRQRTNQRFEENRFKNTAYQELGVAFQEQKSGIGLQISVKNLTNYIYFDQAVQLQQSEKDIQVVSVDIEKRFRFLRNFQLYNKLNFQTISNEELIPLPAFSSYHSFFYGREFFKSSLRIQMGADLWLISDYQGYAYSPENAQFFINPSDRNLGNIQQLDLFVNFGITANGRFFVKMENVLQDSYSEDSERIYQYPVPGRSLKVGLSWRMIN
jgi:hypothetical protein